jgi:AcrR family transcriptional regulator
MGTRERILDAARKIVDANGVDAATMKAVADAAGISRQAVYLHFSDRAQLLVSLSDYIDEARGLGDWMTQIESLGDGREMLRTLAVLRCQRSAGLVSLVRSVENARFRDQGAHDAWFTRHQANVDFMSDVIVRRLQIEGRLHPTWEPKDAATFLVTLFSLRNWDDLTQAWGWSDDHYVEVLVAAALSVVSGPARIPSGSSA